ncbi:hypothetical protein [Hymenobacter koreensis]|uniref:Tetratricopeptide repeat protein n=1 Tax=Hymenobacter koreensis TaxID=1084523 RepID=A0ABP8J715_9BACT
MKRLLLATLSAFTFLLAQPVAAGTQVKQQPLNTLPRYGGKAKSKELQKIDRAFVGAELKRYRNDARAASDVSVELGWQHLAQQNPEVSIKRFNQAWLLDSTNCNVYYGFSACLSMQGDAKGAREYFRLAQRRDPKNQGIQKYNERLTRVREQQTDTPGVVLS